MKKNLTMNFQAPYCNTLTSDQSKASKTMCFCAVKNDIKTLLSHGYYVLKAVFYVNLKPSR